MTDNELDELMRELDTEIRGWLDRLLTPERMKQRLREIKVAAGYDPDAPAATSAETKIQP